MKVLALITIVTGKGIEILPNQTVDIADAEAKYLIERGFVQAVAKQPKPQTQKPPQPPQVQEPPAPPPPDDPTGDDDDSKNDNEKGSNEPVQPTGNKGQVSGQ